MIRIAVDSSSDYLLEELAEKHIELVPISIVIGRKSYLDGIDLDRDEFYKILTLSEDFPKTSQPSPQAYLDLFEDVRDKGDELIYIALSSALSGTYQSAMIAKDMVEYDKIHVVDSLNATYNIKVLADYALKRIGEGASAEQIVEELENLKGRVKVVAALDTLEYLSRGGRIGKTTAKIGNMVNIKPVITLTEEGTVGILNKCLGRSRAINYVLDHIGTLELDPDFPFYTIYSYGTSNCERFEERLALKGRKPDDRMQIGATIGTHIGPEAFGVIFVAK